MRSIWDQIYQTQAQHSLRQSPQPATTLASMQPSKSHQSLASLRDLGTNLDRLSLNSRTATSTPAPQNKLSSSPGSILTPPADAPNKDPFLNHVACNRQPSKDPGMHLESKAEDNVFGGSARLGEPRPTQPGKADEVAGAYLSPDSNIAPRPDRLAAPITPQNAQGVLLPEACVFVANLLRDRSEEELAKSVHAAFDRFGECIVKVRRDRNMHPYAMVQYHTIEAADKAIKDGSANKIIVDDRTLRTEHAQARRSVILIRTDRNGGAISKELAQTLLSKWGPLKEMHPTTHADGLQHGIPEGMWVKFAYFLDFKQCLKEFNQTTTVFQVIEPPNLESRTQPEPPGSDPALPSIHNDRSTTCQKSIFVGNLPMDVTEEELTSLFACYGEIKGCNVIRKPITSGYGYNVFGFIEYSNTLEAERAAEVEMDIRGHRIRVEPKEYSARKHTRTMQSYAPLHTDRRRGISWGSSASAYQTPPAMPYGFQPIFLPQPPHAMANYPGYGFTQTPPSSGYRKRAPTAGEYMYGGSPQHYVPTGHQAYTLLPAQYGQEQPDEHQHPPRRYQ